MTQNNNVDQQPGFGQQPTFGTGFAEQPAWMSGQLPQPPAPSPKKRRRWPWITLGAVVIVIVIAATAGNSGNKNTGNPAPSAATSAAASPAQGAAAQPTTSAVAAAPPAAPAQDTIVYTVTGGHAGDITYISPGESVQESQLTDRTALPWSKTWTLDPSGYEQFSLTIEAQNAGGGTIGCSITVNGKVIAQNSSSGEYSVVTCSP
ncbi:MAG TPA: MmpS family transport accessory protein [Pseudonocardiaceae bacterium]